MSLIYFICFIETIYYIRVTVGKDVIAYNVLTYSMISNSNFLSYSTNALAILIVHSLSSYSLLSPSRFIRGQLYLINHKEHI